MLDTSAYGEHTYSVMATSADGLTATTSITYWVAEAATASITSPLYGSDYIENQSASTSFSCSDGAGGPGILSCVDSNGSSSPGALNTSSPGVNTYSVTATSADGLTATTSVDYNVIGPPTVNVNIPSIGNDVELGQSLTANFGCVEYAGAARDRRAAWTRAGQRLRAR